MDSSGKERKWVKKFGESNYEYQAANALAFTVEHLNVSFRAIKDITGYEISTDNYKKTMFVYHAFLHLYISLSHAYSVAMPINVGLFGFKTYGQIPQIGDDNVDTFVRCSAQAAAGFYHNLIFLSFANPLFKSDLSQVRVFAMVKLAVLSAMDSIACISGNKVSSVLSSIAKIFAVPEDSMWSSDLVKSSVFALEAFYEIYDSEEQIDVNITKEISGEICAES
jgi:hypothetical protein